MIRILQLGMTDNLGGIETFIMNYYRKDKKRIKLDLLKCKFNIYVESKNLMKIYYDLLIRKGK